MEGDRKTAQHSLPKRMHELLRLLRICTHLNQNNSRGPRITRAYDFVGGEMLKSQEDSRLDQSDPAVVESGHSFAPGRCDNIYCLRIQPAILSSATGEMVSSLCAYSVGEPVLAVWKRWFKPGISSISACLFPPSSSAVWMAGRFCADETCKSFSPLSASTGQATLRSAVAG